MTPRVLRIGLLIRRLTVGGAERQLVGLALGLRRAGHDVHVLVFYRAFSTLEAELDKGGVPLVDLQKQGRWDLLGFVLRLRNEVRNRGLDVVYSFLPTSNVLAAMVFAGGRHPAIVWGIRSTDASRDSNDWLGQALVLAERRLALRADAIIANSSTAIARCRNLGWPSTRLHLVHNGLDPKVFQFEPKAREEMRARWGIAPMEQLIGVAARLDPVKGMESFLTATQRVIESGCALRVVVAGEGSLPYTASLEARARRLGIDDRILWIGHVEDMAGFYSALDLLCLPSLSEGCSNVVAEALACGTPVVATQVGDNSLLVPVPSQLVAPGNDVELSKAILCALTSSPEANRDVLRRGILVQLELSLMIRQTIAILRTVVESTNPLRAG